MAKEVQEFDPVDKGILDVSFEALFDGDEIDGKTYALGDPITGLDAPTAHYLETTGRIARISDEKASALKAEKRARKKDPPADAAKAAAE